MGKLTQWPGDDVSSLSSSPSDPYVLIHIASMLRYLAKCPQDDCKTFRGDSGKEWVKIEQLAYNLAGKPPWASDLLREQGAKWTVTIPPKLAPGAYLLRHEILGLHVAEKRMGAQFYPSCTQIRVTQGGSTQLPEGVSFPGAYSPDDSKSVSADSSRRWKNRKVYADRGST